MLIAISGIDCAGKTTQLERLKRALNDRSLSVHIFWYRPGYSKELDALRAYARSLLPNTLPNADQIDERSKVFARPGVSQAWIVTAFIDMALQYAVKLRALLTSYDVVLCDRFFADAALDFALRFPQLDVERSLWFELVQKLSPSPSISLLLLLPYEEMLSRMEKKKEPFPDPPNIRDRRYEAYMEMARSGAFSVIDAGKPVEDVHQEILTELDLAWAD